MKSPPRRLSTTPPSTPGAHTRGPPRILCRWSKSRCPRARWSRRSGCRSRADGQPVGSVDPGLAERVHRLGHRVGVLRHVLAVHDRRMRGALGDALDPAGPVAVEDRHVLPDGDLAHRLVQLVEIDVDGAAVGVVQLHPRDLELGPELDQGQDPPLGRRHTLGRSRDGGDPAQVGGRMRPAVRPVEVDQLAGGQVGGEPRLGLVVDERPSPSRRWAPGPGCR